jgi:hypothetical protein
MNLPHTIDREFKRVAKAEGISMEALVAEVALLTKKSERQIYNFRSGKWELPPSLFPVLCNRFRSRAILDALIDECEATPVDLPESFDLTKLISQTVREDLRHYEQFIDAYEDGAIDAQELAALKESGERVVLNVRRFEAIALDNYERHQAAKGSRS